MGRLLMRKQKMRDGKCKMKMSRDTRLPRLNNVENAVFYRAMLCIARTMLSQDVRLSVRPSVTCLYSIEMAKHIITLFPPSGSHAILVFPYQTGWQYSDDVECKGV